MRPLVLTHNISLDGSVEFLDDWFDPGAQGDADNADLLEETGRQDAACDALLLGRRTFEDFRSYWPHQAHDGTGITEWMNATQKYVVSATMTDPGWVRSTVLSGDFLADVAALKETEGLEIVCTGSIRLVHELIGAGLVDEIRLFVYPVVQGRGRRLFPDGFSLERLRLLESRSFRSGVTLQRYAL